MHGMKVGTKTYRKLKWSEEYEEQTEEDEGKKGGKQKGHAEKESNVES
jgi:hypothetical protein